MEITTMYSFLVYPGKHEEDQPEIGGVELPLTGNLYGMLSKIFDKSPADCNIDIAFSPTKEGEQQNPRRNDIINLLKVSTLDNARELAKHLQQVTTNRSGFGLLFIVIGKNETDQRIYIARFPADYGIVAQEEEDKLRVELLEQVFMKNATSYKAVVYTGNNFDSDFWIGKAIDKQISNNSVAISSYWIRDFLMSDFKTTSATGTRRLAKAIKQTMDKTDDVEIKEELAAAARLAKSLNGKLISMENFADRFALSQKSKDALTATLTDPNLRFTQFLFSSEEFSKHVKFRSLQISNGAMLTAPIGKFDDCFQKKSVGDNGKEFIFSTRGQIVDEKLKVAAS